MAAIIPNLDNTFSPDQQGLLSCNFDPFHINSSGQPVSGRVYFARVPWKKTATITNILMGTTNTAGSGFTASSNYMGIYTADGVLQRQTADLGATWSSLAAKTIPLASPYTALGGGKYGVLYIAFVCTATTMPFFSRMGSGSLNNMGITSAPYRMGNNNATSSTAATTLPSTYTLTSMTAEAQSWWFGLN